MEHSSKERERRVLLRSYSFDRINIGEAEVGKQLVGFSDIVHQFPGQRNESKKICYIKG